MSRGSPAIRTDHGPTAVNELVVPGRTVALAADRQLLLGQVAEPQQQVVGSVDGARPAAVVEGLQLQLEFDEGGRVEELPQLVGSDELGQHPAVESEGLRSAFGEREVALVVEVGDVPVRDRRRER